MPFPSQFALSLELTRLLPLRTITDEAAQAIINFGRQLKGSGSDFITEEDLVLLFGRSKISFMLESSFKTLVGDGAFSTSLWEGIMLQAGPGPTVGRALREPPYLSMAVQLSLLTWLYDARALATALAEANQKRAEGRSSADPNQSLPSSNDIYGVLQACHRQTAAFDWNKLLQAVNNTLGYSNDSAHGPLPAVILQGALDMLPAVQSLPEDRMVYIRLPQADTDAWGTCPLVVWTHQVLDLTVVVRRRDQTLRFGEGATEQVIIEETSSYDEPSITLLDALGEELLDIRPEPDTESMNIDSVLRLRAKGSGNNPIFSALRGFASCVRREDKAVIEELQVITCAMSQIIAKHLYHDDSMRFGITDRDSSEFHDSTANIPATVDQHDVLEASRFLFDNPHLKQKTVDNYVLSYAYKALKSSELSIPNAFRAACHTKGVSNDHIDESWEILFPELVGLSVLNLAFAHVLNIEDCEALVLGDWSPARFGRNDLLRQVHKWDGRQNLYIAAEAWLQVISEVLIGSAEATESLPWNLVCLVSDGGWSAWLPIFAGEDPASIKSSCFYIRRGTPYRNGAWKAGVWDMGPLAAEDLKIFQCEKAEGAGQKASLRCAQKVSFEHPFCGEIEHCFVVFARFKAHEQGRKARVSRIGFRELLQDLWCARLTKRCGHRPEQESIDLPVNCATLAGFEPSVLEVDEEKLVALTAGSISARWLALVSFCGVVRSDGTKPAVFLRDNNCCFQCAMNQCFLETKPSVLIL